MRFGGSSTVAARGVTVVAAVARELYLGYWQVLKTGVTPCPARPSPSCFVDPGGGFPCISYSRPDRTFASTGMRLVPIDARDNRELQGDLDGQCRNAGRLLSVSVLLGKFWHDGAALSLRQPVTDSKRPLGIRRLR